MVSLRLTARAADFVSGGFGAGFPVVRVRVRRALLPLALSLALFSGTVGALRAGPIPPPPEPPLPVRESRWEVALETATMFGLNNSNDYQTLPQILSLRWQPQPTEQFFHTPFDMKRQFTLSAVGVPFVHGAENHYFGLAVGVRQVWNTPGSRWSFYIDGRFAVGAIDSTGPPLGQGQDLTFSALVGTGLMYEFNPRARVGLGFLYEHFSNGGLSEPERPNIGLDTIGPNLSVSVSF
jgi:hypothetical protein